MSLFLKLTTKTGYVSLNAHNANKRASAIISKELSSSIPALPAVMVSKPPDLDSLNIPVLDQKTIAFKDLDMSEQQL